MTKLKLIALLTLLVCINWPLLAQRTVTGKILVAQTNEPLSGVKVAIVGTSIATLSDFSGEYEIEISNEEAIISVFLSGYIDQQQVVGNRAILDFQMYRIESPEKTPSKQGITTLDPSQLGNQPVVDLEQATQGRAAGVFVQNSGGKLGQGTNVRIRGGSSLSGSNAPLYVIDGIPLSSDNQSDIDPSTIESMEILKDASATAIYGARAANGVVLITTKKGSKGMKLDADYQLGISTAPKRLDMLSPDEYQLLFFESTLRTISAQTGSTITSQITPENLQTWLSDLEQLANTNTDDFDYTFPNGDVLTINPNNPIFRFIYDTDWQEEIFRQAISNRANLSLSGGGDNTQTFASINFLDQEGILIGNDYQRIGGRLTLNSNLTSKLNSSVSGGFVVTNNNRINEDADSGNPMQAILLPSADAPNPNNNLYPIVRSTEYNPLTEIEYSDNIEKSTRANATATVSYQLTDGLVFSADGGLDFLSLNEQRRQGPETEDGGTTGFSRLTETNIFNYQINTNFTYTGDLGGNNFSLVVGGAYQKSETKIDYRQARVNSIETLKGLDETDPSLLALDVPGSASSFLSAYLQAGYLINDKIDIQATARLDGSSRFSEENQFGIFPALGIGWDLSKESFLSSQSLFSLLKLSASYGIIGNTPADDFLYRSNYFNIIYGTSPGLRISNLANSQLKWESTGQLDLGIQFGLLAGKLSGSVNYYHKSTSDLLFPVPVSQTSGFGNVLKNVGSMTNQGIEIALGSQNISTPNFSWNTDFNVSTNTNKITDLNGQRLIQGVNSFIENQPAGAFYMPEYLGVNPLNGNAIYKDNEFGQTEDYNTAVERGRNVVGNPNPKLFGGLTNTLNYKNITFSFMFQFVQGIDLYWETGELIANSGYATYGQTQDQTERWYSQISPGKYPRHDPNSLTTNPSTRWLVDGSYIRLNSASLSYSLPKTWVENLKLGYVSFYIGGQNLFTITQYPGYDPDVSSSDPSAGALEQNIARGRDFFTAPQPRTITTGVKIGF